jgi:hypothetical protein
MSRTLLPALYGPRKTFARKADAEEFARHLTRELTAGGIPHWAEIRSETPRRFVAIVHRFDCDGATGCRCGIEPD